MTMPGNPEGTNDLAEKVMLDSEEDRLRRAVLSKRRELEELRERKRQVEGTRQETIRLQQRWLDRHNNVQMEHTQCLRLLESCVSRRLQIQRRLDVLDNLDALSDCFHIWHRGVYGTINGFRLGSNIPWEQVSTTTEPNATSSSNDTGGSNQANAGSSFFDFDLSSWFADPAGLVKSPTSPSIRTAKASTTPPSWPEVNAGLGTAALLLAIVQSIPEANIRFTEYHIVPLGNFSKVVTKQTTNNTSCTIYNLYSDDRFSFFGKRNFNAALNGFLQCLKDAADCLSLQRHSNESNELPHPITKGKNGELLIDGLIISHGNDGERWTRALRYTLVDLKWIVTFYEKYVAR